jgi:hypothetical protein
MEMWSSPVWSMAPELNDREGTAPTAQGGPPGQGATL